MSLTSEDLADIKQLMQSLLSAQDRRLDEKFQGVDEKFQGMDEKFQGVDRELQDIKQRLDGQDIVLNTILDAIGTELNNHQGSVDDHEIRITRLERRAA